jgi:MFS family permease
MLVGILFSAIGNGLVLPYMFLFVHNILGFSTLTAGVLLSYGALSALVVSPIWGSLVDRYGARPVLMFSLVVSAISYASLSLVNTLFQLFFVFTFCCIGQSGMWPAQGAINTFLTPEHLRERIYGAQFAVLNLGIGIGGLLSSTWVKLDNARTFEILFIGDGISYLLYLSAVIFLGKIENKSIGALDSKPNEDSGWSTVLADRIFRKVWLISLFAIFCGYAQLEVGFAAFSTSEAGLQPRDLAWAFAANTFLIATCQLWVTKKLINYSRKFAISAAVLFWALAWAALALSGIKFISPLFWAIACQFIFGIGEMIWSPILPSIVNQLASDHLRGRYNSASAATWQVGQIAGPAFAGLMLGWKVPWLWISLLITALVFISIAASKLNLPKREQNRI